MEKPAPPLEIANLTLITGGARSGKSAFAESLAARYGGEVIYIATMEEISDDEEAIERIRRHQMRRPPSWQTREVPFDVHHCINEIPPGISVCLLDCLSLYVSNMLLDFEHKGASDAQIEQIVDEKAADLLAAMSNRSDIRFLVVTNEVGAGIVPEHKLARIYRDLLGLVNQQFAKQADEVWLCCVGLQLKLKPQ